MKPKSEFTISSATINAATIIDCLANSAKSMTANEVADALKIDKTKYDMNTRLWNLGNQNLLKKRKSGRRNKYSPTKIGLDFLEANKDEVQEPGKFEIIEKKPYTPRGSYNKKKPEPEPKEEEQVLSKVSTAAFEGISDLINFNEEMNQCLETVEMMLAQIIDTAEENSPANDLLGMPLIDARKKRWKGIFADIAQVVFDNADTLELIKKIHDEIDGILRVKYDYQDTEDTEQEA